MDHTKPLNETMLGFSLQELHNLQRSTGLYFTITVIEGQDFGCIFPLEKGETVIGRKGDDGQTGADIELNDDRSSRRHILLAKRQASNPLEGSVVFAIDLGSKNGTILNGKKMATETELHNGDKFQIGNTVLKFEVKDKLDTSYQERLYQQVTRDPLTKLWNHNYIRQEIEKTVSTSVRSNSVFSLMLIEIDFFQTLNETFGHDVGDAVLKTVADIITGELSDFHIASRFAGKQFLILMPDGDIRTAGNTAELIRQSVETHDFSSVGCTQGVTLSAGVVQFPLHGRSTADLIKQADEALFRAKQIGRNRVQVAEIPQEIAKAMSAKKIATIVAIILLVGLGAFGARLLYAQLTKPQKRPLLFSGMVETREIQVGSKVGGRVAEVLVKEGETVKAGAPLVKFDIADLKAQQSVLQARIAQAEANLEKQQNGFRSEEKDEVAAAARKEKAVVEELRNGPRPQEIAQVKASLSAAELELNYAKISLKRIATVQEQGFAAKQLRDDAQARVDVAEAHVEELQQKLKLLEAGTRVEQIQAAEGRYQEVEARLRMLRTGTRSEDIASARAELMAAKAEMEKLNVLIAEGQVLAPTDAVVQVVSVRPGDIIQPNRSIAKLLEQEQMWVKVFAPQTDMARIKVNQKASIKIDSFAESFPGYVEQISSEAEFYPRNVQTRTDREHQVFALKIHVDNKDGKLKSAMAADVTVEE